MPVKVKVSTPQQRAAARAAYHEVTFSDGRRQMRKFTDGVAAKGWLIANGYLFMASRKVVVHGEYQMFFAKSDAAYERGEYALYSSCLT